MAQKTKTAPADNELEILHPEQELTLAGETITVHEFTFLEGLKAQQWVEPIVTDLGGLFTDGPRRDPGLAELNAVFAEHASALLELLSLATGKPRDWLERLSDADGSLLTLAFWTVNSSFFLRRILTDRVVKGVREEKASAPASSSPR